MKVIKTFALSSISLVLMSGCFFEESYDPNAQGNPPLSCDPSYGDPTGNRHRLYDHTNCSDTRYSLVIVDKDGNPATVGGSGHASSLNIKTEPAGAWSYEAPIKVTVSEDAPASIKSITSEPLDLTIPFTGQPDNEGKPARNGGIVRFFIKPLTTPENDKKVLVKMPVTRITPTDNTNIFESGDGQAYATFDLTSAIHAYLGVDVKQEVKIPTSCFMDEGVNYTQMTEPFILMSESNLEFELSEIMIRGDADGQAHVIDCEADSEILPGTDSEIFTITDDDSTSGWAVRRRALGDAKNGQLKITDDFTGNEIAFEENTKAGGLRFLIGGSDSRKDISRFMQDGLLEFNLYVADFGNGKETRDIKVTMEAEGFGESNGISEAFIVEGTKIGEVVQVSIPVAPLMTRYSDGQGHRVDVDLLRNIDAALRVELEADEDDENDNLDGASVLINNVYLVRGAKSPGA